MEGNYLIEAKIFKAFCDEKRLRILDLLQGGEKCVCALIEEVGMPQSTLSYHMKILCDAGVVEGRQEGKWTHYSICEQGILRAAEILKGFGIRRKEQKKTQGCCVTT
jgi:ArsR family transcriptional regulator